MNSIHDAPIFRITDRGLLHRFCTKYGIDAMKEHNQVVTAVARAFSSVPYENLTKIIKSTDVLNTESAIRTPNEVIGDHLKWGTGGTCFSLTAAIIAVFNALGIESHPLLADRHYGPETHCGLVVKSEKKWLLLDPGYLLFTPVLLPVSVVTVIPLGYTTVELSPIENGHRVKLTTIVQGNRKLRLTYKRVFVDAETFMRAWQASFTWEMMTYPVITRLVAGAHIFIQGEKVAIRNAEKTDRFIFDPSDGFGFIRTDIGIHPEITAKAWGIVHGTT